MFFGYKANTESRSELVSLINDDISALICYPKAFGSSSAGIKSIY